MLSGKGAFFLWEYDEMRSLDWVLHFLFCEFQGSPEFGCSEGSPELGLPDFVPRAILASSCVFALGATTTSTLYVASYEERC